MNPPSTKSMFSTGHSMLQCQQNSVMRSVCNRSRFLRFIGICTRIAIREKRLKIVHSTY